MGIIDENSPQLLINHYQFLHAPHVTNHPKQTMRYIDSDILLFNKLKHLLKNCDPVEAHRAERKEKLNRDLNKKDDSFIES